MHRTYIFIVNGDDVEYTEKTSMVNDTVLEYIYILKRTEIKVRITINHDSKKVS